MSQRATRAGVKRNVTVKKDVTVSVDNNQPKVDVQGKVDVQPKVNDQAKVDVEAKVDVQPKVDVQAKVDVQPKVDVVVVAKDKKDRRGKKNVVSCDVVADSDVVAKTVGEPESKRRSLGEGLEAELKFKSALTDLRNKVSSQTEVLKNLKSCIKKVETSYQQDMNKALKAKRKRSGPVKATGFVKELNLAKDLAELIGVPEGTKISMPTYTKKFYEMLKANNLFYEQDGRVLRANEEIKRVFKLPDSVNESTDYRDKNGFNFYTLQKHIAAVNKTLREKDVNSG